MSRKKRRHSAAKKNKAAHRNAAGGGVTEGTFTSDEALSSGIEAVVPKRRGEGIVIFVLFALLVGFGFISFHITKPILYAELSGRVEEASYQDYPYVLQIDGSEQRIWLRLDEDAVEIPSGLHVFIRGKLLTKIVDVEDGEISWDIYMNVQRWEKLQR